MHFCEIKNDDDPYIFTKKYYEETKLKLSRFKQFISPKKRISYTFISNNALVENEYSLDLVDNKVFLEDFFES